MEATWLVITSRSPATKNHLRQESGKWGCDWCVVDLGLATHIHLHAPELLLPDSVKQQVAAGSAHLYTNQALTAKPSSSKPVLSSGRRLILQHRPKCSASTADHVFQEHVG